MADQTSSPHSRPDAFQIEWLRLEFNRLIDQAGDGDEEAHRLGVMASHGRQILDGLQEQFEVLRQAEEAARVQERVGNEGDADAIRRSAIAQVLKLGIYADLNPAKKPSC